LEKKKDKIGDRRDVTFEHGYGAREIVICKKFLSSVQGKNWPVGRKKVPETSEEEDGMLGE